MATKMFRLESADFLRGLAVAVLTAPLVLVQQLIVPDTGEIQAFNWKAVGGVALAAGIAYILKNLVTNQKDEVLGIAATAPETTPPAKE